jgi:tRNA(Arg) A34 adenosine deaminase TadA
MQHEEFMKEAIQLANRNVRETKGGPFGAIVVKDGEIVGKGFNTVTETNDPTAHAEINAIRDACKNLGTFELDGCIIYSSCEPCPMCLGAIYWARPAKLYYGGSKEDAARAGFADAFIYEEIEKPTKERKLPTQQIMRDDALISFKMWELSDNKIEY